MMSVKVCIVLKLCPPEGIIIISGSKTAVLVPVEVSSLKKSTEGRHFTASLFLQTKEKMRKACAKHVGVTFASETSEKNRENVDIYEKVDLLRFFPCYHPVIYCWVSPT